MVDLCMWITSVPMVITRLPAKKHVTIHKRLKNIKVREKVEHFAYLDPTTGSLFIQALIGSIAGVGFIFRNSASKILNKVSNRRSDTATAEE
jgi:hypothetical protein